MQKGAVKRAVSLCKLMLEFSLLIFTSCFVDQSHARLFVEFYIRACDKLTFFSKYARVYRYSFVIRFHHKHFVSFLKGDTLDVLCAVVILIVFQETKKKNSTVLIGLRCEDLNFLNFLKRSKNRYSAKSSFISQNK